MRIILTGASGFLGKHISAYFAAEELITVGRKRGSVVVELANEVPTLPVADFIIHAAGKAHVVPKTKAEVADFFHVNVQGTKNLLTAIENTHKFPSGFIFISSIAVYGKETGTLITERSALSATDPYGKSKIEAEQLVRSWCEKNHVPYAILRLPLIAGPNPPGNLKSMITGIKKGYYFNIAGGKARKSMVMAESIPPILFKAASVGGIYNLTDGYHPSFDELSQLIARQTGKGKPISIPYWLARLFAITGNFLGKRSPLNTKKFKKIINDLTFDDLKARKAIEWNPSNVIDNFKIY